MKRKAVVFVLGFLTVWFAVGIAAPFFFDSDEWTARMNRALQARSPGGAKVGTVRLSMWTGPRLVIEDIELRNPEGRVWFSSPLVQARVSLSSLLAGAPRGDLVFDQPQLRLETEDLRWLRRWYFARAESRASSNQPPERVDVPAFLAASSWAIRMRDASVTIIRGENDARHSLANLQIFVQGIDGRSPIEVEVVSDLSLRSGSDFVLEGPVKLNAKASRIPGSSVKVPLEASLDCSQLSFILTDWIVKKNTHYCYSDLKAEVSSEETFIDRWNVRYRGSKASVQGHYRVGSDGSRLETALEVEIPDLTELFEAFPVFARNGVQGRLNARATLDGLSESLRLKASGELLDFRFHSNDGDEGLRWNIIANVVDSRVDEISFEERTSGFKAKGSLSSIFPLKGKFDTEAAIDTDKEKYRAPIEWLGHQLGSIERRFSVATGEFTLRNGRRTLLFKNGHWMGQPFAYNPSEEKTE